MWTSFEFCLSDNRILSLSARLQIPNGEYNKYLVNETWTGVHVECVPYYPVHSSPLFSVRYLSYTTSCIELIQYRNLSQTYQFLSQRVALILKCIIQGLSSLLVVIATDDVKWQELHLSSAFSHYTTVCILSLYTSFIQPITSIVSNPYVLAYSFQLPSNHILIVPRFFPSKTSRI